MQRSRFYHTQGLKLLAIFILFTLFNTANAMINITALRLSNSPEKTRLVFDLSGRLANYQLQRAPDNLTVLLGLPDTHFIATPPHGIFSKSYIDKLRINNTNARVLQLILTLRADHQIRVFTLPQRANYGNRLVIDVLQEKNHTPASLNPQITPPQRSLSKLLTPIPKHPQLKMSPAKKLKAHPFTALTASSAERTHPIIIVIDPGHGGKDPGAAGKFHAREKHIVLAIAKKLYTCLNKMPGMQAKLTRSRDYYIPLRKRLQIARRDKADFFISIHADAYPDPRAHGASIYALSPHGASSEAARWLAQRENYSELGHISLSDKNAMLTSVLLDLSQTATNHTSVILAGDILTRLNRITRLHRPRVEQAPFMVLKSPDIPSLLIETGFISNATDEHALTNSAYQNKLANAIAKGIRDYVVSHPLQNTVGSASATNMMIPGA